MKTSVVIGRFQINNLHNGHQRTINEARSVLSDKGDQLVILIGVSPIWYRDRNPLSYEIRKKMIEEYHYGAIILPLYDNPSDKIWSQNLDEVLKQFPNPTLFGSRDSFIPHYSGIYPTKEVKEVWKIAASTKRASMKKLNQWGNNSAFRRGVIHAVENQFPTAFPTVDIAVIDGDKILLGRKPGKDTWCLIGGFVDPTDDTLEDAAARELGEEVGGIVVSPMTYLCSQKINDFRYKGSKDGIISSLFICDYISGTPVAADDIEEVKWFPIKEAATISRKILTIHHAPLLIAITNHLKQQL